ncbi:MAG: L-serine ammonia-lyase, iron-sulfur-dependent, subunit alpha [Eubacteriales bacterium]|nr:L-serine ammonia-lyase, iron-sulfur-dependent, subunit alpha [Eubacteriales bacterium]
MDKKIYDNHLSILRSELTVALGCTEPIAIAYAAAVARKYLGCEPSHCVVHCSGNIVKNVKGVFVPNSGGLRGINVAAILGVIGANPELELACLEAITDEHRARVKELIKTDFCECKLIENVANLYIVVELEGEGHSSLVEIQDTHKNITRVIRDGETLVSKTGEEAEALEAHGDKSLLSVRNILEFADAVKLADAAPIITPQIELNMAICREGLEHPYGAEVGRILLGDHPHPTVGLKARAHAAAGSDARMSGCPLPVVINSGSGNQGITVSVPVVIYAQDCNADREKLIRSLVVANLISVHQKKYIGSLSAYCGVISAACGAACGICYMYGYSYEVIAATITNTIATIGGMVCDGAKSSCAAKIATALQTALLGMKMAVHSSTFQPGEGLVEDDVEMTISNIGRMGRVGMKETDTEILNIMLGN